MLSSDEYYNRFDDIYEQSPSWGASRITGAQLDHDNSGSGLIGDNFFESLQPDLDPLLD